MEIDGAVIIPAPDGNWIFREGDPIPTPEQIRELREAVKEEAEKWKK